MAPSGSKKKSKDSSSELRRKRKKKPSGKKNLHQLPLNHDEEKRIFFAGFKVNPNFIYGPIPDKEKDKYRLADSRYLDVAIRILETVLDRYGTESNYQKTIGGDLMTKDEVESAIKSYLSDMGLANSMEINFTRERVAATSVEGSILNLRLPVAYRQNTFYGVLNHEVGTHHVRWLNEQKQPWRKKHRKYDLLPYITTEEGLATINQSVGTDNKYLWRAALHYYSCYLASKLTFVDLFHALDRYIDDPSRRWMQCLRTKRGVTDTSLPGCYCKDQVYLIGAIQLLRRRQTFDFRLLYCGKITADDLKRVSHIVNGEDLHVPAFLEDMDAYRRELDAIVIRNGLEVVCHPR